MDAAGEPSAPVLGLYGGNDAGIPVVSVEKMRAALRASKSKAAARPESVVHPEAGRGPHADCRPSYNNEAAAETLLTAFNCLPPAAYRLLKKNGRHGLPTVPPDWRGAPFSP